MVGSYSWVYSNILHLREFLFLGVWCAVRSLFKFLKISSCKYIGKSKNYKRARILPRSFFLRFLISVKNMAIMALFPLTINDNPN